jgi:hypothetical protein
VVNDFSSRLDHPLETVESIDANHMQMAKFKGMGDAGYQKLSKAILSYIQEIEQDLEAYRS